MQEPRITCKLEDVKKLFEQYVNFNYKSIKCKWDDTDYGTFKELGYEVLTMHICKSCGKQAKGGKDKCCSNYHSANRVKRVTIIYLEIVSETIEPPAYNPEVSMKLFA